MAINSRHNQNKGAQGPEEWAPPYNDLWCRYATDWTEVKYRWLLAMTQRESEIVMDMLYTYDAPPDVEVELLNSMEARTGEHKTGVSAYGCCKEAEAARERRMEGSQSGRKGFPKTLVPSARDGDSHGVVCEAVHSTFTKNAETFEVPDDDYT